MSTSRIGRYIMVYSYKWLLHSNEEQTAPCCNMGEGHCLGAQWHTACFWPSKVQEEAKGSKWWNWKQWLPLLGVLTVRGHRDHFPNMGGGCTGYKVSSCSTIKICAITICISYINNNTLSHPPIKCFVTVYNMHTHFGACNSTLGQASRGRDQGLANFSCKGPNSKCFCLCKPSILCCQFSPLLLRP